MESEAFIMENKSNVQSSSQSLRDLREIPNAKYLGSILLKRRRKNR